MPAYLIRHPTRPREDILVDGDVTLSFSGNWAIFSDTNGPTLAVPADHGANIQRIDPDNTGQPDNDKPAPEG